ncbi:similar to Saccharomyces cerevisiae YNL286W CUS2 Protein that binds to U2 snRNA and Prp11p, may be involved in U2 snRNA folding [Maudiozyma saulgeensis]|uniref:Similar to Saccharomyces cerevisiae YNL286W CUS2 Protein that binds to U2 snRNA and Prp11p, may be involved in U2 snRNA folding n=1 Tax=Maudiozyma saulgeensis TaxID=1789683 RepID=A0A1X7R1J5_9SACH|nr:similar to Saccharomyces cerevisiae YNL286W CUS2 Protein that binds to U2 snRNA and Prp11p, may be involved in U2 snRNA folding [Kazachstania saulgeensis]
MSTTSNEFELQEILKQRKKKEIQKRKLEIEERKLHQIQERKVNNTSVYISNIDISSLATKEDASKVREQLVKEFSRFGVIRKDEDGVQKCTMYKDENGKLKGDALVIYANPESVPFAIDIMNGFDFNGTKLHVEKAIFEPVEASILEDKVNSTLLPSKRLKTDNHHPESKVEDRSVVLANIIDIYADLDDDELEDIKEDIKEGCQQFGKIAAYKFYENKGEATVTFTLEKSAQECQKYMDGRFFDGRKVLAFISSKANIEQGVSGEDSDIPDVQYDDVIEENDVFIQGDT